MVVDEKLGETELIMVFKLPLDVTLDVMCVRYGLAWDIREGKVHIVKARAK
jgi:hypothetical protein